MELLAPAGGFEQLRAAIHFGADAVYLGGERFGLRKRADNFADDDLKAAVDLAHEAGVRVHVTVNALMHEADLAGKRDGVPLVEYLHMVEQAGADAIIAGDLGTIMLARREVPGLDVHVSTQMSCANHEAARAYRDLGVKRVVLARELALEEIREVRANTPDSLELEVFVHGAMCMAHSGRCLISNHLTGRDANRGHCTQPCRWIYTLEEEKRPGVHFPVIEDAQGTSILSSKDLMMIEHLDELRDAGVDSIKIEGRVKSAYYVATVVNAYRHVLDGAHPADFLPELDAISHRSYHTGFFYGQPDQVDADHEYEATHIMTGIVLHGEPIGDGNWSTTFMLRNRMISGQSVEVLSPGQPVRAFTMETAVLEETGERVEVANRTCGTYRIVTPFELRTDDILRRRRDANEARGTGRADIG